MKIPFKQNQIYMLFGRTVLHITYYKKQFSNPKTISNYEFI